MKYRYFIYLYHKDTDKTSGESISTGNKTVLKDHPKNGFKTPEDAEAHLENWLNKFSYLKLTQNHFVIEKNYLSNLYEYESQSSSTENKKPSNTKEITQPISSPGRGTSADDIPKSRPYHSPQSYDISLRADLSIFLMSLSSAENIKKLEEIFHKHGGYSKEDMFKAFVAGDTEGMRRDDDTDNITKEEFELWLKTRK